MSVRERERDAKSSMVCSYFISIFFKHFRCLWLIQESCNAHWISFHQCFSCVRFLMCLMFLSSAVMTFLVWVHMNFDLVDANQPWHSLYALKSLLTRSSQIPMVIISKYNPMLSSVYNSMANKSPYSSYKKSWNVLMTWLINCFLFEKKRTAMAGHWFSAPMGITKSLS